MFRTLTAAQEKEFREWARNNYKPFGEISKIWHPAIQAECVKINKKEEKNASKENEVVPRSNQK